MSAPGQAEQVHACAVACLGNGGQGCHVWAPASRSMCAKPEEGQAVSTRYESTGPL